MEWFLAIIVALGIIVAFAKPKGLKAQTEEKPIRERPQSDVRSVRKNAFSPVPREDLPVSIEKSLVGKSIIISYMDMAGEKSSREIKITKVFHNGKNPPGMYAFCMFRNDERTFYFDRIMNVVDLSTGECFDTMYAYANYVDSKSDAPKFKSFLVEYKNDLTILLFHARFDGYLRAKEKEVIIDFINRICYFESHYIEDFISDFKPDTISFNRALKSLSLQNSHRKENLLNTCSQLAATKKNQTPLDIEVHKKIISALK